MPVRVLIPTPLQRLTQNQEEVVVEGADIREVISNLEAKFPGVKARLCDENGTLRRFVNIYLNEEDIRFLKGESTPLKDGDEVSIVPAIAGGVHV
jgi:sulfur-carrier protein